MSGGRLSQATLSMLGSQVPVPASRPTGIGIVHLGIGAFHRAHQAVYTQDAMEFTGETGWGICGVTQRSNTVLEQLLPQDCLYTLLERGAVTVRERGTGAGPETDPAGGRAGVRVVGAVREVRSARAEPLALRDRLADPAVRVVTLTVTEKGYRRGSGGRLDLADPAVRDDLAGGPPATVVGQLVSGLRQRWQTSTAPLTILPCDNLAGGGAMLRGLVHDFCAASPGGDQLAAWIDESVSFPSSVVDRIVPATGPADLAEVAQLLGVRDQAAVVAEPYRQWIIEDDFAAGRPAWDAVGAVLTDDVTPYEAAKLRLLNAAHSLLAYTGALAGYDSIAEAVSDPALAEPARRLLHEDAAPTLVMPRGFDIAGYCGQVLDRFANPALRHRTTQVAMDGSQKLPLRLLGTVRDRLAAGVRPEWAALAVAAWMVYVARGTDLKGRPLPLTDPLADRLRSAVGGFPLAPVQVVDRLLAVPEIFGADLPDQPAFRELLVDHVTRLLR